MQCTNRINISFRVLDLVEILVKSQPPADLTLVCISLCLKSIHGITNVLCLNLYYCCCVYTLQDLIFPLLELVASTEKLKEGPELDLGKRAGNMFRMLYKKAKVCTSSRTLHKGRVLREFTFKKVNNKYCTYFSLFPLYTHLEINCRESLNKAMYLLF